MSVGCLILNNPLPDRTRRPPPPATPAPAAARTTTPAAPAPGAAAGTRTGEKGLWVWEVAPRVLWPGPRHFIFVRLIFQV